MLTELIANLKKTPEERKAAWEMALFKKMNNIVEVEVSQPVRSAPKPDLLTQLHQDREKMDRIQKHNRMGFNRWARVHEEPQSQDKEEIRLLECARHPSKELRLLECAEQQSTILPLLQHVETEAEQIPSVDPIEDENEQIPLLGLMESEAAKIARPPHGNRRHH